jgi:hypothetical protein
MCFYHAYTRACGHTEIIFQNWCPKGQMIQQKCGRGHEGIITMTVRIETPCRSCVEKEKSK